MKRDSVQSGKALVIGSGIGGLSTAILLAKLNYRVTVIEGNPNPGGLMRGYLRRGLYCPVGVHYMGALGDGEPLRRLFDCLGVSGGIPVERMGREGTIDRYVFNDSFSFPLPEGIDVFEERLRQAFPAEQRQITEVMSGIRNVADHMKTLDFLCSMDGPLFALQYADALEGRFRKIGCSTMLQAVLGMATRLMGLSPAECPVFYHHMALVSLLFSSWRTACSGNEMVDAFVNRFRELGGTLISGNPVKRIQTREKAVKGVVLHSGQELEAPIIVAAIHPRIMLNLLSEEDIRPVHRDRILNLRDTAGVFAVNLGVDAKAHPPWSHNVYHMETDEEGRVSTGGFYQLRQGEGDTNLLTLITGSTIDEWKPWEATLSGQRGKRYEEAKERKADALLEEASNLCGSFSGLKKLDIFTPLTLRDRAGSPNGSTYGILRSIHQLMPVVSLQRPVAGGLFLAGQNLWAPGIIGTVLGSFQVVKQMIGFNRFQEELIRGSSLAESTNI